MPAMHDLFQHLDPSAILLMAWFFSPLMVATALYIKHFPTTTIGNVLIGFCAVQVSGIAVAQMVGYQPTIRSSENLGLFLSLFSIVVVAGLFLLNKALYARHHEAKVWPMIHFPLFMVSFCVRLYRKAPTIRIKEWMDFVFWTTFMVAIFGTGLLAKIKVLSWDVVFEVLIIGTIICALLVLLDMLMALRSGVVWLGKKWRHRHTDISKKDPKIHPQMIDNRRIRQRPLPKNLGSAIVVPMGILVVYLWVVGGKPFPKSHTGDWHDLLLRRSVDIYRFGYASVIYACCFAFMAITAWKKMPASDIWDPFYRRDPRLLGIKKGSSPT